MIILLRKVLLQIENDIKQYEEDMKIRDLDYFEIEELKDLFKEFKELKELEEMISK